MNKMIIKLIAEYEYYLIHLKDIRIMLKTIYNNHQLIDEHLTVAEY